MTSRSRTATVLAQRPLWSCLGLGLLVAVVSGAQMWMGRDAWVGWGPATTSSWVSASAVGGPSLVAASAAWWAGAVHRSGLDEWLRGADRRRRWSTVVAAGLAAMAGIAGVLTVLVLALGWTVARSGHPVLPPTAFALSVLPVVLALGAVALVASWAATVVPTAVVVPGALVVPYLWYFVSAGYGANTPLAVIGPADGTTWDYVVTSQTTLIIRMAIWSLTLGLLLASIMNHRLRHLTRWVLGAGLALAVLAGFAVTPLPGASTASCTGVRPAICLTAPQEAARSDLATAAAGVLSGLPPGLRPQELSSMDVSDRMSPTVLPAAKVVDPQEIAGRVGEQIFTGSCTPEASGREAASTLLTWWWMAHTLPAHEPAYPGAPTEGAGLASGQEASRIAALREDDQQALLQRLTPGIRSCTVTMPELP